MSVDERTPLLSPHTAVRSSSRDSSVSRDVAPRSDSPNGGQIHKKPTTPDVSTIDGNVDDPERGSEPDGIKSDSLQLSKWWRSYLYSEVPSDKFLQAQLLFLTFSTGIIDAVCLTKYGCFATKQTGNTVFLALQLVKHPYLLDQTEENIFFSFGFFVLGCVLFAKMGHMIKLQRRISLLFSSAIQTALVWAATAVACFVTAEDEWPYAPIIISLLAFATAGQISVSIQTKQGELNTSMVTGAVIAMTNDSNFFQLHNPGRNKKLIFCVTFFLGIVAGGAATLNLSPGSCFILHAGFKTVGSLSFLFNPRKEDEGREREESPPRPRSRSPLFRIFRGDIN